MNRSIWQATAAAGHAYPALDGDLECDVLVVGGGIAGLTSALLLQRGGVRVTLIEARRIGAGETGRTTAHLTEVLDARYHVLASKFGDDGARGAAEASRAAIACIESLSRDLGIECGFRRTPGYLYAENEDQLEELAREADALVRVGAESARSMDLPLPFPVAGIVRIENQARFHPLRYLVGLAEQFTAAGGQIFEATRLCDVHDGTPCKVGTDHGAITARAVLVLTHVPVSNRFAIHTKIAPYRSYAVSARVPNDAVPEGLFWDLADPYHYIRGQETVGGKRLIVGGEDHKTGQEGRTEDRYAALERYVIERFPGASIERRWSGQIIEPADGLPFIGRNSGARQVFVATGFSGTGMTFGTLAGMILSDAILEHANPWADLFEATRIKPVAQARRYVAENADFPSHLASDRFDRGEVGSVDEIPTGEGRLVRCGGKMLAVYRGDDGAVQARSAVCTHLGCHVHWNDGEKSWDCPCHGSRFDTSGQVINGPAVSALPEAEAPTPLEAPVPERA